MLDEYTKVFLIPDKNKGFIRLHDTNYDHKLDAKVYLEKEFLENNISVKIEVIKEAFVGCFWFEGLILIFDSNSDTVLFKLKYNDIINKLSHPHEIIVDKWLRKIIELHYLK